MVTQLTQKHALGIHDEMIGDGILTLVESGAVRNRLNNYPPGKQVATLALGSAKLHRFMDRNPALEIHPVDFTNAPALAGQKDKPTLGPGASQKHPARSGVFAMDVLAASDRVLRAATRQNYSSNSQRE